MPTQAEALGFAYPLPDGPNLGYLSQILWVIDAPMAIQLFCKEGAGFAGSLRRALLYYILDFYLLGLLLHCFVLCFACGC